MSSFLDKTGLTYLWSKIQLYFAPINHTHTRMECNDALLSKAYTGVVRSSTTYASPYTPSYFYFGKFVPIDLSLPAHITYHIIAYGTSNSSYLLDAIVRWDVSTNGIYKAYWIWNSLNSTSYYPFGYHTLYRSNNATISASDGCYFGGYFGTSTSYGQNPTTVERTFEVEILEAENCTASLTDSVIFFDDTENMPSNLVQTSTSSAFNTTNFTAVNITVQSGLQETGDANSSATGYNIRRNNGKYLSVGKCYRYMLLLSYSETQLLPINSTSNDTGTSKVLTTESFDPFGTIFYYSSTTTVNDGAAIAIESCWTQFALDLRYSFNEGTTLINNKDIYIVAVPQSNGRAVLANSPISQDLPTTEDGYIYIYLGHTYSTYNIVLSVEHPIYYYYNGALRPWTNSSYDQDELVIAAALNNLNVAVNNKQDIIDDLSTIRSNAALGATALQSFTETDPTVSAWAKAANKPTYTATEVGALPDDTVIPTKTSDLTNDSGFITNANDKVSKTGDTMTGTLTLSNVPINIVDANGKTFGFTPTKSGGSGNTNNIDIGYNWTNGDGAGAAFRSNKAGSQGQFVLYARKDTTKEYALQGNTDGSLKWDGRRVVTSTDNTSVGNSTTPVYIDANGKPVACNPISVPTKTSDLTNDSGYITSFTETDPVFGASAAAGITSSDITSWDGKQNALVSGTTIKTINNTSLLGSGNISISTGTPIVTQTASSVEIAPNCLNQWGEIATLTITLATPSDATIVNEYMIEFTSGSIATTLSLPANLSWYGPAPYIEAGKTYQISIINNVGVWGGT